jgi:molybdate transport repressor ModE-like protein
MKPGFSVWLEEDGRHVVGEREARVLAGLRKFGSLMATAKSLGITYAHAWNVLNALTANAGVPVVMAKRGGEDHGGTELTKRGAEFLEEYERLQKGVSEFLGTPKGVIFGDFVPPELSIIGSSCVGVKIIIGMLGSLDVEYVEIGSTAGLAALMLGEADISGIHLYDVDTGEYNWPFLARSWPSRGVTLVRGYRREQGLMLKKGNPRGVSGLKDLVGKEVRLVNRNLGSGTRELLDRLLAQKRIASGRVKGYDHEVRTHDEVAKEIEEGRADVGLGLRATAERHGLEFVRVCEESFDFAIDSRRMKKRAVQAFLGVLRSEEFRDAIAENARGLRILPSTGDVVNWGRSRGRRE